MENKKSLFLCAAQWCIIRTSIKTALLVGTILALINHYENIFSLKVHPAELIQIIITYLVPFTVATYAAARHAQRVSSQQN